MATIEAVGGAMLDELPPVPLAPGAVDPDVLDRLLDRPEEPASVIPVLHPDLPAPLDRVPMGRWWPIGIGLRWRPLRVSGSAWAGLIWDSQGEPCRGTAMRDWNSPACCRVLLPTRAGTYRRAILTKPRGIMIIHPW